MPDLPGFQQQGCLEMSKGMGRVSEMRIDAGPGYRLYYTIRGSEIVFILAGGDKSTQQKDFQLANLLADQDFDFE